MRIEDRQGNSIDSLDMWATLYETPQRSRHWKKHRSAYSIADFMINHDGAVILQSRISAALNQPARLERAIPEYEVRFDKYGRGRVHDLGVFGQVENGESIFVGVEAKVDESFGKRVEEVYPQAKAKQLSGSSTKVPERIEGLLKLHFNSVEQSMFDIRYQLLYATAGTIAEQADTHVLYIIVFKTPSYNKAIGAKNEQDYLHFLTKVGGKPLRLPDQTPLVHEVAVGGKRLVCIYDYFDL